MMIMYWEVNMVNVTSEQPMCMMNIMILCLALLARLVEHFLLNWKVLGSNPGLVQWLARSL